jgi:hypothetical protein
LAIREWIVSLGVGAREGTVFSNLASGPTRIQDPERMIKRGLVKVDLGSPSLLCLLLSTIEKGLPLLPPFLLDPGSVAFVYVGHNDHFCIAP